MREENRDMNPDPITKQPGSHPVGTAVGSAGAAAAGAAIGAPFGPIGMLVGGALPFLVLLWHPTKRSRAVVAVVCLLILVGRRCCRPRGW